MSNKDNDERINKKKLNSNISKKKLNTASKLKTSIGGLANNLKALGETNKKRNTLGVKKYKNNNNSNSNSNNNSNNINYNNINYNNIYYNNYSNSNRYGRTIKNGKMNENLGKKATSNEIRNNKRQNNKLQDNNNTIDKGDDNFSNYRYEYGIKNTNKEKIEKEIDEKEKEEHLRARQIVLDRRHREKLIKEEEERQKKEKEIKEKEEKERKEREERERKERIEKERKEIEREKREKERKEREMKEKKEKEEKEKKEKEEKEKKEKEEKEKKEKEEKEKKEKEEKEKKEKEEKEKKEKDIKSNISLNIDKSDIQKIISSEIGFRNLGNTCFMNTCLQNLIHTEYFIQMLFSKSYLISDKTPISQKFMELCKEFISTSSSACSPDDFKREFGYKHRMFSGYRQQDTQEFCRFLLEDMNSELNEVKSPAPYKELSTLDKTKEQCDKEFDELFRKRENSLIIDVFYAQLINIFKCTCNFETYSFQKILDFPLLLQKNRPISIEELLNEYFEGESIEFGTKCEKCGKKTVHEKKVKISQLPNVLILSLQRINERTGTKNDCTVSFPDELDLSKYIEHECWKENKAKYTLYGIGNHSGSLNFGHYYAYIKIKINSINEGKWYEYNDSIVSPHIYSTNSSSTAYVLFYKK